MYFQWNTPKWLKKRFRSLDSIFTIDDEYCLLSKHPNVSHWTLYQWDEFRSHSCPTSTYHAPYYLEQLSLSSQPFSAELHDRVGAESVPDAVLTERAQPQRQAALQLEGRDQDRLVTWVNAARRNARACKQGEERKERRRWRLIDDVAVTLFTLRGTTEQNPDRSRDPGRWLFGEKSRVHTAALWSDTAHWPLREISGTNAPKRSSVAGNSEGT